MIPLILAGVGIGVFSYWAQRKLRHKKATLGGMVTAAVVGAATAGFGGPVFDTLLAAPMFAAEGAVAGELENHVAKPVENFVSGLFHHHDAPATPAVTQAPSPPSTTSNTGTSKPPVSDGGAPYGNDGTMPADPGSAQGGSAITPSPRDNTIGITYQVRAGDTVYSIAKRAKVSQASLLAVNPGITGTAIQVGQIINVPCPNIDTAGPGAPKSPGCAAQLDRAFKQQLSPSGQPGE